MSNEKIEETKRNKINILKIIIPILIAVISFTLVAKVTTSSQFNKSTIEYLDTKRANAISLSVAEATTATTISLILFFFIWIVKMIFNVDIDTKKLNFLKKNKES